MTTEEIHEANDAATSNHGIIDVMSILLAFKVTDSVRGISVMIAILLTLKLRKRKILGYLVFVKRELKATRPEE